MLHVFTFIHFKVCAYTKGMYFYLQIYCLELRYIREVHMMELGHILELEHSILSQYIK